MRNFQLELTGVQVESRMGASADAERRPVSHPRSSNRTCGLPASGFPTGFTVDSRTRPQLHLAELQNSQLAKHHFCRRRRSPSLHAVLTTPVDRCRCLLVEETGALPRRVSSLPVQPSPFVRRVGIHDFTFEACSSFTRVTACKVAHPPYVGFIARLRPHRFPGSDARKLSSPTNNYLSGSFPHW
jgi:hypothetical protein